MTRYELACDKRITLAAIVFEILMVVSCILLLDAVNAEVFKIETVLASHVSVKTACICVLVLQYLIVATECIARYRSEVNKMTLPLVFLPGGIIFRTLFMFLICATVVSLKLVVYFVSILITFVLQIVHLNKVIDMSELVDIPDRIMEPIESNPTRAPSRNWNRIIW